MAGLFVDTWGWLALRDKGEAHHRAAVEIFQGARKTLHGIVTTDYVLDEAITLLFRRLAVHKAKESLEALLAAVDGGEISLAAITPTRFAQAVKLRLKYRERPEISFTDFTSMVVMRELGLQQVLTEDGHFAQVGLGFELVP
jgi:predicted nucleic acid-binding protein